MEGYFAVVAKSKSATRDTKGKMPARTPTPSQSSPLTSSLRTILPSQGFEETTIIEHEKPLLPSVLGMDSTDAVSTLLLKTLSDPANPITHSSIGDRTQHYVAFARGHQVADERVDQGKWMAFREAKLKVQRDNTKCKDDKNNLILSGVKVYINGYLESTTDIEMKRVVTQSGGQVLGFLSSQCTHIITSRSLSGSKTHKLLTKKTSKVKVVNPDWVFDSLAKGKRQPERPYSVLQSGSSLKIC